jgi:hypothetical protein
MWLRKNTEGGQSGEKYGGEGDVGRKVHDMGKVWREKRVKVSGNKSL